MGNNDKRPKIRFKGFNDDWEQHEFGEIFKLSQGLQIPISKRYLEKATNRYFYITNEFLKDSCEKVYYIESPAENVICTKDDILMTRTGNTGIVITDVEGCFHNNFFKIQYNKDLFSKNYICYLLKSEKMKKKILNSAGSSTIPDLSHKSFYKIDAKFPILKEQYKIGEFFKQLDSLIVLHQRKLEKLGNIKKSMLEKMFPKDENKVPEIRFKGFNDDWEQHKLFDLSERITRKNINLESKLPLTISAQYGLVDQITFFNNRVASRDVSNYFLIKNGEFAYNKSYSDGYPYGVVKRLDYYDKGVLSTLYIIFSIDKKSINSNYLLYYFNTDNWYKHISECAAEGARNHGLLNISADDFFELEIKHPKDLYEQKKVGEFLKQLDSLISLHQRKLEKLKNIKKACLEKMFV